MITAVTAAINIAANTGSFVLVLITPRTLARAGPPIMPVLNATPMRPKLRARVSSVDTSAT